MMDAFLMRLSPLRRSPRRTALRELSVTSPLRRSVSGNGIGVSGSNLASPTAGYTTSSPDERIIQQRGRRSTAIRNLLVDMTDMETDQIDNDHDNDQDDTVDKLPDVPAPPSGDISINDSGFDSPDGVLMSSTPINSNHGNEMHASTSRGNLSSLNAQTRKRLQMSPTKEWNKRKRATRKSKDVTLDTSLKGLNKDQLIDVLCGLVEKFPNLESEVKDLSPSPDLEPLKQKLDVLERNVYKSFPSTRWSSSRDGFCYRRVKTHLEIFKREMTEMGESLIAASAYTASLDYVIMAWAHVERTPNWDNKNNNRCKNQCYKTLAAQCLSVVKKAPLEKEQLNQLSERLADLEDSAQYLSPCLTLIARTLEKLH